MNLEGTIVLFKYGSRGLIVFVITLFLIIGCSEDTVEKNNYNGPLFTLLPKEKSNVTFINNLPESQKMNILVYQSFYSGAGVSLQDVARANIINNTIAHNDSTATSALSFQAGQTNSTPQPSGLVSAVHSTILQGLLDQTEPNYSDPMLINNIIWQNRSYYNDASLNGGAGGLALNPAGQYWDIHVFGSTLTTDPHLNPDNSILSSLINPATGFDYTAGGTDATNNQGPPGLLSAYFNFVESTTIVDEGGNSINLRFTPVSIGTSDYHIGTGQAWNNGSDAPLVDFPELAVDFDGESRPFPLSSSDIGADEIQAGTPAQLATTISTPEVSPSTLGLPSRTVPTQSAEEIIESAVDTVVPATIVETVQVSAPTPEPVVALQGSGRTYTGKQKQQEEERNASSQAQAASSARETEVVEVVEVVEDADDEEQQTVRGGSSKTYKKKELQSAEKDDLELAREDLAKNRESLKDAIENLEEVKKDPESMQNDMKTAVNDLERAMIDVERAADYLQILATLLERSLIDPKSENKELKQAKKDLNNAWKDLVTAINTKEIQT